MNSPHFSLAESVQFGVLGTAGGEFRRSSFVQISLNDFLMSLRVGDKGRSRNHPLGFHNLNDLPARDRSEADGVE